MKDYLLYAFYAIGQITKGYYKDAIMLLERAINLRQQGKKNGFTSDRKDVPRETPDVDKSN